MKLLRIGLFLVLMSFGLVSISVPVHRATATQSYYVASMSMDINPGSDNFVVNSLNTAKSVGADHFVLVLNTFGGDGRSMDDIIGAISSYQASGGTFITLIAPSGAHAFSAGSYIAEASDRIYMTPGTTIGSATPIVSGIPTGEENTTMTKDINGFTTYMQALTSRFGRNATATGLMVSKGVSYAAERAYRLHVITGVVNSTSVSAALSVIGAPSGIEINTPGPAPVLLGILSDPNVSGLLFLVGVFAILADLYHPTIVLSVVGAAVIILALVGLGVFGAPITAVLLMFIGALFIFLEVKTHHGISAVAGVIIFAVGFLLVFETPPSLPSAPHPPANFIGVGFTTYALLALLGAAIVVGSFYLYRLREQVMHRARSFDPTALIGRVGRMTSELSAGGTGSALLGAEEWTVTSRSDLRRGDEVKVKDVKGLKLIVEKKE
jgi:membrane-bound serine protease (ClpP class)